MSSSCRLNTDLKRRTFKVNGQPTHASRKLPFTLMAKPIELTRMNKRIQAERSHQILLNECNIFILRGYPKTTEQY